MDQRAQSSQLLCALAEQKVVWAQMKERYDLGQLQWTLAGWTPYVWQQQRSIESGVSNNAEIPGVPACIPGSVQGALLEAGIIPDWNVGLDARLCEWVENRHWVYTARLPDEWLEAGKCVRLHALGLDYSGWLLVNGNEVGRFMGSFVPHRYDLTDRLRAEGNTLQLVFDTPPRWLGQIGYTSEMTEWKERFNYFWDWTSRLVQIGVWDSLLLEISGGREIDRLDCRTSVSNAGAGSLRLSGDVTGDADSKLSVSMLRGGVRMLDAEISTSSFSNGVTWNDLAVELWWPNGEGEQSLYDLEVNLLGDNGESLDQRFLRVGFKSLEWVPCEEAPPEADPWICVVNGRPIFMQGVNWTPIRPNFADVSDDEYRSLLEIYRGMGCNTLRVWGGAFLEKEVFYSLCDELGILVWQEFPLSSSGLENWPPEHPHAIEGMAEIAESYIERRRHHVSLAVWCGGNELQSQDQRPVDESHPLVARLAAVVKELDPTRRFLATSPSGPRFSAEPERFGQGQHWDVHGPWHITGDTEADWTRYWSENDALFHSEVGVAGASPAAIIREYKGDLPELPATTENPLWRRTSWWIDAPSFEREREREPESLEEYVGWSQARQRRALEIAARETKARFPRCGGFLVWMGHDCFPCTANTSVIDFHGKPKPAAAGLREVFRGPAGRPTEER